MKPIKRLALLSSLLFISTIFLSADPGYFDIFELTIENETYYQNYTNEKSLCSASVGSEQPHKIPDP
jgi:hypothetical protein